MKVEREGRGERRKEGSEEARGGMVVAKHRLPVKFPVRERVIVCWILVSDHSARTTNGVRLCTYCMIVPYLNISYCLSQLKNI